MLRSGGPGTWLSLIGEGLHPLPVHACNAAAAIAALSWLRLRSNHYLTDKTRQPEGGIGHLPCLCCSMPPTAPSSILFSCGKNLLLKLGCTFSTIAACGRTCEGVTLAAQCADHIPFAFILLS